MYEPSPSPARLEASVSLLCTQTTGRRVELEPWMHVLSKVLGGER